MTLMLYIIGLNRFFNAANLQISSDLTKSVWLLMHLSFILLSVFYL